MSSRASIEGLGRVSRPEECGGEGGAADVCGAGGRALSLVSAVAILSMSRARRAYKAQSRVRNRKVAVGFHGSCVSRS